MGLALLATAGRPCQRASTAPNPSAWWSLQPLTQPRVPHTDDQKATIENPLDAFLLAKLREKGLGFAPPADHRTLIRRLSFDLTGLPPQV